MLKKILRLGLQVIPLNTKLRVLSGPARGMRWIKGSGNNTYWIGNYEVSKQAAFVRYAPLSGTVFDVGAHVGFYTLLASRLVGSSGSVVAFEPDSRNLLYLREHVYLNRCNNVLIVPAAVTDIDGPVYFSRPGDSTSGRVADSGEKIQSVSLDVFIETKNLIPNLIKIDVEGGELQVLRGATRIIHMHRPILLLALHGEKSRAACIKWLEECGYFVRALDGRSLNETDEITAEPLLL